jgi:HJR/Mrr/RecB family endonuclease
MKQEEIRKDISISSRLKYITDEETLKIIDFIIDHSFKDSEEVYTNGTILVPLYRVLDSISQKGEPYNEG